MNIDANIYKQQQAEKLREKGKLTNTREQQKASECLYNHQDGLFRSFCQMSCRTQSGTGYKQAFQTKMVKCEAVSDHPAESSQT